MSISRKEKKIVLRFRKILSTKEKIILPNGDVLGPKMSGIDRCKILRNYFSEIVLNETELEDYDAIDSCVCCILTEYSSLYLKIFNFKTNHRNYRKNRDFNKRLKERFVEALENANIVKAANCFALKEKTKTGGYSQDAVKERKKIKNSLSIFSGEVIKLQELASKLPTENYILEQVKKTIDRKLGASVNIHRTYFSEILMIELKYLIDAKSAIAHYASMDEESRKKILHSKINTSDYMRLRLAEKIDELALENYTSEEIWDYLDKNLY